MRLTVRAAVLATVALLATVCLAVPAFGYDEITPSTGRTCIQCHGTGDDTSITPPVEPSGPHGGYTTTTNKCATCHSVHVATVGGIVLLPASTIKATCMTCHDGTATTGNGVYGAIEARTGFPAESDHSIDTTLTVPGGDAGGGAANRTFSGVSSYLTCSDCHSPHGTSVVNEFTGDRARSGDLALGVYSSRLLKQRPTSYTGAAIADYGSDWCGACHPGRLSGSGMANNHPVESSYNQPDVGSTYSGVFIYESLARYQQAALGTLGGSNLGYRMEWVTATNSYSAEQTGHAPICQQCHEDARDATAAFSVTAPDGRPDDASGGSTDNPRFQTFPHESDTEWMLVSVNLCTNCHTAEQLQGN